MMIETQIILLVILLILSATFSGIETALMSLNKVKVNALVKDKVKGSLALARIKKNPHSLLITILIGNNLVNILAASIATVVFTDLFGSRGVGIATGIMTLLILLFGEITPKTIALQHAKTISLIVAKPIELLTYIIYPIVYIFEKISRLINSIFGPPQETLSEQEIKTIVSLGKKQGILSKKSARMIENILEFEGVIAAQIMTPKSEISMIDGDKKLHEVLDFIVRSKYSRFPVYVGDKNNIKGVLDVDDVLKSVKNKQVRIKVKKIVRKIPFVSEKKEIDDLLIDFEGSELPVVMVVDGHGEVEGLVSVEDILEEIVGDIFDKSKKGKKYFRKIDKSSYLVDARIPIRKLNSKLNMRVRSHDTLEDFILHATNKKPKKGKKIELSKITIEIDQVFNKEIKTVIISKNK